MQGLVEYGFLGLYSVADEHGWAIPNTAWIKNGHLELIEDSDTGRGEQNPTQNPKNWQKPIKPKPKKWNHNINWRFGFESF